MFHLVENWQTRSTQCSSIFKILFIMRYSFPANGKSFNLCKFSNWWKPDRHTVGSFQAYAKLVLYNKIQFSSKCKLFKPTPNSIWWKTGRTTRRSFPAYGKLNLWWDTVFKQMEIYSISEFSNWCKLDRHTASSFLVYCKFAGSRSSFHKF